MLKLKSTKIGLLFLLLIMQSCVFNNIMCLEDDDIYFSKNDIINKIEMQKHLEKNRKIEDEVEIEDEYFDELDEFED